MNQTKILELEFVDLDCYVTIYIDQKVEIFSKNFGERPPEVGKIIYQMGMRIAELVKQLEEKEKAL